MIDLAAETRMPIRPSPVTFKCEDIAPGGRVGLVALSTDFNSESELRQVFPAGVEVFTNRVWNANPVTAENLRAMSGDVTRAAASILPGYGVDILVYGCTSGTLAIGEGNLAGLLERAQPRVPQTNPIAATREALRTFRAQKISVLTPYTQSLNQIMFRHYQSEGFDVLNLDGFGLDTDVEMTGVPQDAIVQAAIEACHPDADALFISCTALRSVGTLEALEHALGKPVVASNQAIVWHALQLLGNRTKVTGFGQLFEQSLKS